MEVIQSRNPFVNQVFVVNCGLPEIDYGCRRNPFVNQVFVVSSESQLGQCFHCETGSQSLRKSGLCRLWLRGEGKTKLNKCRNPFVNQVFVVCKEII